MPSKRINYEQTYFYKICCKDVGITDIYIGHTTNFNRRRNEHKSTCNNINSMNHNMWVYQFIRENGGYSNWDMILIETKCCENALDATKHERLLIETLHATLNKYMPSRSHEEVNQKYYMTNKETIKEYRHTKCTCECGGKYTLNGKSHHLKTKKHLMYIQQKTPSTEYDEIDQSSVEDLDELT